MSSLFCIWQMYPEHIVLQLDESGSVLKEHKTTPPPCSFGTPRGGTGPLPYKGEWIRFCHALQINDRSDQYWTYHLAAILMEPQPPFAITKISSHPIMTGTEQYFHGNPRWKPRVLIPYGAVRYGDGWRVSVGVNDSACGMVDIKEQHLNLY